MLYFSKLGLYSVLFKLLLFYYYFITCLTFVGKAQSLILFNFYQVSLLVVFSLIQFNT